MSQICLGCIVVPFYVCLRCVSDMSSLWRRCVFGEFQVCLRCAIGVFQVCRKYFFCVSKVFLRCVSGVSFVSQARKGLSHSSFDIHRVAELRLSPEPASGPTILIFFFIIIIAH